MNAICFYRKEYPKFPYEVEFAHRAKSLFIGHAQSVSKICATVL